MWLYIVVVALQLSFVGLTQSEKSTCELTFLSSICCHFVFDRGTLLKQLQDSLSVV